MGKIEIIGQQPAARPLPGHHCPHCNTERPPYGFHLNGGDLGMVGTVQYFTIFCAAELPAEAPDQPKRICGAILSVNITQWQPPADPATLAALHRAMTGGSPS